MVVGHTTYPPSAITYASVVSREMVSTALTLAHLNNFPSKGRGHSKHLHHITCHGKDMDSPGY